MQKKSVWLLSAGHLFTDLNQGALPAMLPFLIEAGNLSYTAAGGLIFAASFASSIIQPLFGHLSDKRPKPWLMPAGLLIAGGGMAAIGLLHDYWVIFTAVTISGIGIAAFHPEAARLANQASGSSQGTGISIFAVGGNIGFAVGPAIATAALLYWGLAGTLALLFPAVVMALLLAAQAGEMTGRIAPQAGAQARPEQPLAADQWRPFAKLTAIVFCRSVVFYGLNTFIPLYWLTVLQQDQAAAGSALTILFTAGAAATLAGGRLADRLGYIRVIRKGMLLLIVTLLSLILTASVPLATLLLIPVGLALFAPYSPMVVLGQKYLPNRIGLASGVTLGLAVSAGGITVPLLGWLADNHGVVAALWSVIAVATAASLLSRFLSEPRRSC